MTKKLIAATVLMLGYGAPFLWSGVNFGRLNVPDTAAGPSDYLVNCVLPLLLSVVVAVLHQSYGSVVFQPQGLGAHFPAIGKQIGILASAGDTEAAKTLLDALEKCKGVPGAGGNKGAKAPF